MVAAATGDPKAPAWPHLRPGVKVVALGGPSAGRFGEIVSLVADQGEVRSPDGSLWTSPALWLAPYETSETDEGFEAAESISPPDWEVGLRRSALPPSIATAALGYYAWAGPVTDSPLVFRYGSTRGEALAKLRSGIEEYLAKTAFPTVST